MTDRQPSDGSPQNPTRVLGPFDAGCIVVGAIIGVGIFFTPSRVAALTGTGNLALAAWTLAGFIAMCGALTFAQLGARYHAAGAQYEILRDAYGPLPGFVFVFCNATAIQAGATGIIAIICIRNIAAAAGRGEPEGAVLLSLSIALISVLMAANIIGVKAGSAIQNITVAAKVIALLAVTGLAVLYSPPAGRAATGPVAGSLSPVAGVMAALVPAFFSYGGWQHALWISGEVKDPRRNLPRSIVGGVLLVVIVYVLANWAYLRLLGVDRVAASGALAADAVGVVYPGTGARVIAAAVAVSALGVLNAQLLSGPRLVYGMARDGRFFSPFAKLSRTGTPWAAILLIGAMAIVLLLVAGQQGVDRLTTGVVFIDGVFFAMTGAAVFLRRVGGVPEDGAFRAPGFPVVPALFVIGEAGVVIGAYLAEDTRHAAVLGVAWIAAAVVLYLVFFRSGKAGPGVRE
ncbi:MAG: APC family permease [Phycisphaerales bacterium]|nr:APC family permease [Phycisphaerales bacterium]